LISSEIYKNPAEEVGIFCLCLKHLKRRLPKNAIFKEHFLSGDLK
jgi:hypothetical protein